MKEFKPPIYQVVYPADGFCYAIHQEELKNDDWVYSSISDRVFQIDLSKPIRDIRAYYKIIATNNDNSAITDVPRLQLDGQEDLETLAMLAWNAYGVIEPDYITGFQDGYKAAKDKGMYSEDEVRKAIEMARELNYEQDHYAMRTYSSEKYRVDDIINFLKSKPIAVELDGQVLGTPSDWLNDRQSFVPKVVNNTVIVKRLIYGNNDGECHL